MQEGTLQTRDLHNFAAVDQTTDVSALVAALDLAHSLPFYQDVNRQSYARLHVQPGHHLLEGVAKVLMRYDRYRNERNRNILIYDGEAQ
jgi:hypothetical protein